MEREKYQTKAVIPGITLLYGFPEECCIYAVEGERAVALIDTGMGKGDLPGTLEALAPGKRLLVFNTHCHFDHSAGNWQFPEVHLHPGCYGDQDETEAIPDAGRPFARRVPVREGAAFNLGGVTLEVIETPGHTPGDICLLDRTHRILFAGDLIGSDAHNVWMLDHLPWVKFSTVSLECYLRSLRRVEKLGEAFDGFLCGHDDHLLGKEYLAELMRLAESVIAGTAQPNRPDIPSPPGQEPVVCWRVWGEGVPTAILYQEESIFDRK